MIPLARCRFCLSNSTELHKQGLDEIVVEMLGIQAKACGFTEWERVVDAYRNPESVK